MLGPSRCILVPPSKIEPIGSQTLALVRLLALAGEWQGLIDRGELRTRAELAARSGLHPFRLQTSFVRSGFTQYCEALRLDE